MKRLSTRRPEPATLRLLRTIPAFRGCSEKELAELDRMVDEVEVAEGTVLMEEGRSGRDCFVIAEGWAAVLVHDEPMTALGPGELVGEMAMVDRQPRSATVVAKTPMRLLAVSAQAFGTFATQPAVSRQVARTLTERLRKADAGMTSRNGQAGH